ncbi:hypothetical protein FACS1894137_05540 [Spirochaetia bacterium]|nr:hypothetical protein FACS1894137_05540 [Spirochaetia bacterium]
MAFCPNCGTQVKDGAAFCGNCGSAIEAAQVTVQPQPVYQQAAQPALVFQPVPAENGSGLKALRVVSGIGFVWHSFWLLLVITHENWTLENVKLWYAAAILIFGYAIAHAIVALVQGNKYAFVPVKVMAIIGIVLYVCAFIAVCRPGQWDKSKAVGLLILFVYGAAFSIVTFVYERRDSSATQKKIMTSALIAVAAVVVVIVAGIVSTAAVSAGRLRNTTWVYGSSAVGIIKTVTFENNRYFLTTVTYNKRPNDSLSLLGHEEKSTGTYKVSGEAVTLTSSDGKVTTGTFTLELSSLTLNGNTYYRKK